MSDPLLAYRDRFPILARSNYLINNSLGAMPAAVEGRMRAYAEIWATRGVRAWAEEWWALPVAVGDLVAPLLGARPGTVSMHTNVTLATAVFLSCLRPGGGRGKIVTTELQFPSIQYLLEQWCLEHGVELQAIPAPDGLGSDPQQLLEAIDGRTLAVSISHVEFKSAYVNDAAAVAARCRETGALLLLDAFQSAGVVPIEAERWGADAVVGGCLKWLCGGPGNVFLYVDPELGPKLEPRLTGWMAHPRPFGFEPPPMERREDAYRFLNGTPQVACLYAAPPGLEIHNEIGVPAIRDKSMRLTKLLFEGASARGWRPHAPADPTLRGGTVALDVPHGELVAKELLSRDVVVDFRPGAGIRIAPHFYNTDQECRDALDQIREILETKAYERHRSVAGSDADLIHDISPLIDESIYVWPGDTPYAAEDLLRIEDGASVHLSTIRLSCHTGAHADAPGHYVAGAPGIDAVPLERYLGPCRLVDVRPPDRAVRPGDLEGVELEPRLLLRTSDATDRTRFPDPFTCLTEELVDWLAEREVVLVGLDSPSVDPFDSKDLPAHHALHRRGIANLESLRLDGVPAGRYELIALPLRLKGRDASPVRAVLRPISQSKA